MVHVGVAGDEDDVAGVPAGSPSAASSAGRLGAGAPGARPTAAPAGQRLLQRAGRRDTSIGGFGCPNFRRRPHADHNDPRHVPSAMSLSNLLLHAAMNEPGIPLSRRQRHSHVRGHPGKAARLSCSTRLARVRYCGAIRWPRWAQVGYRAVALTCAAMATPTPRRDRPLLSCTWWATWRAYCARWRRARGRGRRA